MTLVWSTQATAALEGKRQRFEIEIAHAVSGVEKEQKGEEKKVCVCVCVCMCVCVCVHVCMYVCIHTHTNEKRWESLYLS